MKLEDKFFKSFFYPFLVSVILSTLVVTIILGIFTNDNYDKKTCHNIIKLEKQYAKININSANVLLSTTILKFQASLNEIITFYQKIANDLLRDNNSHQLKKEYLKNVLNMDINYCKDNENITTYMADWVLDNNITEDNFNETSNETQLQLIAFSNTIPNLYGIFEATLPNALVYYFYFEETELYASFPLSGDCAVGFNIKMANFPYKEGECVNEKGDSYKVYKVKCEAFFRNMKRSKTPDFDYNYLSMQHKTIFINNFYYFVEANSPREFSMCIEFKDPITKGKGYACVDVDYYDLVYSLDNINSDLIGYYFISNIGFNNVFYFPQSTSSPKTSTEYIFDWDRTYKLEEKNNFNKIRKIFSSNYIDYLGNSVYDEIFINGKNSSEQFFYVNEKKYEFSIYPIILENLKGQKEHIFSIIYIFNDQLFFDELRKYHSSIIINIILALILFIIFGSGLLYLIFLSFNTLTKYIIIPIKNVNYMLKGINIGGKYRLKYLDFLKKKQDENLEKLEKILLLESRKFNKEKKLLNDNNSNLSNSENGFQDFDHLNNKEVKNMNINDSNLFDEFNKNYDEESEYIDKEKTFYDFDEQLLEFRSLEIERLIKSLMELKSALIITSEDREKEQIIDYSYSEDIFRNLKNKEGANICQSNIGNLQGQLLKFDKAIYHLALSLQDNKLIRFLSRNLNDELDENDSLLQKISYTFNKEKKKEKINILSTKQMNNSDDKFSQKIIGILINTRYCRLIHVYYMFFKYLKKLQKSSDDIIKGQFMNTLFHTINYYHKIIIQFIFLSYTKKDLVKIGESILDYLEFLIKFKFKSSSKEKHFLKINNRNRPEYKDKREYKKKIFNKIVSWFDLFEDYISHVKDNSSLGELKNIVDDYFKGLNSDNNDFNYESQSSLMFRVNIQKYDFLRGKFCLSCKNYNGALFYFIKAAKKKNIVTDGLIKKKSLKHIYKLLLKMKKKFDFFQLKNLCMEKEMKVYKKNKNQIYNKKYKLGRKITNRSRNSLDINAVTFGEEIENIKKYILENISECNAKEDKDILILIDFNIYDKQVENIYSKTYKIDAFIEQTILILNNYLSINDRFSTFIFTNKYQIICPLMHVNKIDMNNFSKDLIYYKNLYFDENKKTVDNDFNSNELQYKDFEYNLDENKFSENSFEGSFEMSENEEKKYNKIKGLVDSMNYLNNYLRIKEGMKNETYIIVFTDIINILSRDDEQIEKIFGTLRGDLDAIFLLVGKNRRKNITIENYKKIEELILDKFGEKSEIIDFENMKKIKSILSNNNVIKDEIIYPNEIYK